jgi:hypothetical protein
MQLYDMRGNKIVERETGFTVASNISGKRAKETLRRLNENQAGFQGFTPEFFTKDVKISMKKVG